MSTRLPTPGADANQWGEILNNYLLVSHNPSGTLKPNSVGAAQLQNSIISLDNLTQDLQQQILTATGSQGERGERGEKGDKGDPGDTGPQGQPGQDGTNGRNIELTTSSTHIQWRYAADGTTPASGWTNLIALADITGPQGQPGQDGSPGLQGEKGDPGDQGPAGQGVPTGGATGQILAKSSNANYDAQWANLPEGLDPADFATAAQGALAASAVQPATIANFETTAQLNSRDVANRSRANHTGSQAISTISGLQGALDGKANTAHSHSWSSVTDKPAVIGAGTTQVAARVAIGAVGSPNSTITGIEYYASEQDLPSTGVPGVLYVTPTGD